MGLLPRKKKKKGANHHRLKNEDDLKGKEALGVRDTDDLGQWESQEGSCKVICLGQWEQKDLFLNSKPILGEISIFFIFFLNYAIIRVPEIG